MALASVKRVARLGTTILVVSGLLHATSAAAAPTAKACVDASEHAQSLMDEHKLGAARRELVVCADPACPPVVTQDCVGWLREVDGRLPTVVITVRDAS